MCNKSNCTITLTASSYFKITQKKKLNHIVIQFEDKIYKL